MTQSCALSVLAIGLFTLTVSSIFCDIAIERFQLITNVITVINLFQLNLRFISHTYRWSEKFEKCCTCSLSKCHLIVWTPKTTGLSFDLSHRRCIFRRVQSFTVRSAFFGRNKPHHALVALRLCDFRIDTQWPSLALTTLIRLKAATTNC